MRGKVISLVMGRKGQRKRKHLQKDFKPERQDNYMLIKLENT